MRLLAFPFHDWRKGQAEGFRTRDGHLLQWFAADNRVDQVLVVDRPVSRAERLINRTSATARGSEIDRANLEGYRARLTRVHPKILVLDVATPDFVAPIVSRRGWWFDVFKDARTARLIDWGLQSSGEGDPSAIAWTPTVAPILARLPVRRFVFDSLDNWLIHPVLRRHAGEAAEAYEDILSRADSVVVAAPASRAALARWREGIEVVPNGVDPDFFAGERTRPSDLPPGPIVGYAGKLAERIDAELVRRVAELLPGVAFVFVGPILNRSAIGGMTGPANVHLLGDRQYESMPAYLRWFDLAWIPHRVGRGETGGDPIKLYEYWAAGRQVVSTPIDGLEQWRDQVHLVSTPNAAGLTIQGLLDGSVPLKPTRVPNERTWQAIASQLIDALDPD